MPILRSEEPKEIDKDTADFLTRFADDHRDFTASQLSISPIGTDIHGRLVREDSVQHHHLDRMSSIRPLPDEVVEIRRDSLSRMLLELFDHYIDDNLQFERYASRMSEAYSQEYRHCTPSSFRYT